MVQRTWYVVSFQSGEPRTQHVIPQVCSVEAAKQFAEKLPANDKKISLYDVRLLFEAVLGFSSKRFNLVL